MSPSRAVPCFLTTILLASLSLATGKQPEVVPFTQEMVIAAAKRLAAGPYNAHTGGLPEGLDRLTPDQYREIRFADQRAIWSADDAPFRLGLLPAGFHFQNPVTVSLIAAGKSEDLKSAAGLFEIGPNVPVQLAKTALPFSGFTLQFRSNTHAAWDEFVRFQGASYFRALARGQIYGVSARGLVVNIAEPMGEEFPTFTHYWIEQPAPRSAAVVIHALLDSPSITGAYQFAVQPGAETVMDVEATLFARIQVHLLGIAPLTSMFLFDESNRNRRDDYRPEVHDSDGLQITTQSGEPIWRPLANPGKLQISAFTSEAPRGFGLMQRSRSMDDYQDIEAQYERRPSVWIEPKSDWGAGAVELVEIPTMRETNDNITAFWRPTAPINPGNAWHFAYRLTWNAQPRSPKSLGRVIATRSGASADGNRRIYMIDFVGAGEKVEGLRLELSASAGKLSNVSLTANRTLKGMRVGFELDPSNAEVVELRLRVLQNNRPITETWLYRWTSS